MKVGIDADNESGDEFDWKSRVRLNLNEGNEVVLQNLSWERHYEECLKIEREFRVKLSFNKEKTKAHFRKLKTPTN